MVYQPTAEELTQALDDVHYEIQQLAFTAMLNTSEVGINNAILESKLLHVRNLLDFFEHQPRRDDDVLATHYLFPATPVLIEEGYRDRLNKDLAHLTYSRTRRGGSGKIWPHEDVILPVLHRCLSFAKHVLTTRASFDSTIKEKWESLLLILDGVVIVTPKQAPPDDPNSPAA